MSQFTLDDFRAAAEKKFGSTDITIGEETIRLVNPLRMPKEQRKALLSIQEELDSDDAEIEQQEEVLKRALRVACEHSWMADRLLDAVGDDLALIMSIFESYTGEQEVGEASASAS